MFLFLNNSSRSWSVRSYRDTWSCSERTPSSPSWVSVLIIDMTYWCTCTLTHIPQIQMASLHSVDIHVHWLYLNLMWYIYICHHPPPSCRHSLCFLSDFIYWLHPSCFLSDSIYIGYTLPVPLQTGAWSGRRWSSTSCGSSSPPTTSPSIT